ncbi:MAG: hypothetical protein J6R21_05680 [Bacteroidales bacterium]|nr:hypothetical protein [Bacteroidales bacterium]
MFINMKMFVKIKGFIGLIFLLLSFAACDGGENDRRIIDVRISEISKVEVDNVKAFASLGKTAAISKAGNFVANANALTRASGDNNLYVVLENNDIAFPDLKLEYQFGDDLSEEEKAMLLEELQPRVKVLSMSDMGRYALIEAIAYFEHQLQDSIPQMAKIRCMVVRKSDGETLSIEDRDGHILRDIFHRGGRRMLRYHVDAQGNDRFVFGKDDSKLFVTISEKNGRLQMQQEELSGACYPNQVVDEFGYLYRYNEYILTMNGAQLKLDGNCLALSQVENKAYAFTYDYGEPLRVYELSKGAKLLNEYYVGDEYRVKLWGEHARDAGFVDGEILLVANSLLVRYHIENNTFHLQAFSEELKQEVQHSEWYTDYKLYQGSLYKVVNQGTYAQVLKTNLITTQQEEIKVELPEGATMTSQIFKQSCLENNRLDLEVYYNLGTSHSQAMYYNLYGAEGDVIDFGNYALDEVVLLK